MRSTSPTPRTSSHHPGNRKPRPNSRKKRRARWGQVQRGFAPYLRRGYVHAGPDAPIFRGVFLWLYITLLEEESWYFGRWQGATRRFGDTRIKRVVDGPTQRACLGDPTAVRCAVLQGESA